MALIDNNGVQLYANKMVKAENRKEGSKSLPEALADIDTKLDEMEALFDEEYGSSLDMTLENNENVFTVGTGSGVDKSADVENSFSDMSLSGNSMVNLVKNRLVKVDITTGTGNWLNKDAYRYAPNKEYTVIYTVNSVSTTFKPVLNFGSGGKSPDVRLPSIEVGTHIFKFTMPSNLDCSCRVSIYYFAVDYNNGARCNISDVMILEGDYTDKPIPSYFEGLKSIGTETEDGKHKISILSTGKNLYKGSVKENSLVSSSSSIITDDSSKQYNCSSEKTEVEEDRKISISANGISINGNIKFYDKDNKFISQLYLPPFITPIGTKYVMFHCRNTVLPLGANVQIEYSDNPTTYEPYKADKKEILLNEPLRKVNDTIKDTIEMVNGEWKIARRCGEVILNGTENWFLASNDSTNTVRFRITNYKVIGNTNSAICDKFEVKINTLTDVESLDWTDHYVTFRIFKNKLTTWNSADDFKEWLSQNPVKVIYELANPIYEDIEPPTLQVWKNGTISIDEVLPVTSTHTVALSKPAQIKRNIEELTKLRDRVTSLEEFYSVLALEQARSLSLVNTDIQVDYLSSLE